MTNNGRFGGAAREYRADLKDPGREVDRYFGWESDAKIINQRLK